MTVIYGPIKQVEDVSSYYRGQGHCAPVLAQSVNTESMSHEAWENSKEHAICYSSNARDKNEEIWLLNKDSHHLGHGKQDS